MNVFQRKYEELSKQILEHVKMDVSDCDEFSARLDFLRLQKNKITELLSRQKAAEKDFCTEKENTQKALCAIDPLYQEAKKFGDTELLKKFHDRTLTRKKNIEMHKKYGIALPFELMHGYKD